MICVAVRLNHYFAIEFESRKGFVDMMGFCLQSHPMDFFVMTRMFMDHLSHAQDCALKSFFKYISPESLEVFMDELRLLEAKHKCVKGKLGMLRAFIREGYC